MTKFEVLGGKSMPTKVLSVPASIILRRLVLTVCFKQLETILLSQYGCTLGQKKETVMIVTA